MTPVLFLTSQIQVILQLIHLIFRFGKSHAAAFYWNLDPVKDVRTYSDLVITGERNGFWNNINGHYVLAFASLIATHLDCLLVFGRNGFRYSHTTMPDLFTHKIYQRKFWYQGDVICDVVISMSCATYGLLLFGLSLDEKYRLFALEGLIYENGKAWGKKQSEVLLVMRAKYRRWMRIIMATCFVQLCYSWGGSAIINWAGEMKDSLIIGYMPLFVMYTLCGCVNISFYFMLATIYTRVQQRFALEKFESIASRITKHKSGWSLWTKFISTNGEILQLFTKQRKYNRFWSPYVSVYFVGHTVIAVFLAYGLIFDYHEFDWASRSYFATFSAEFVLILMVITARCSSVVRANVKIYKTNRNFSYEFQRRFWVRPVDLLKMNGMISNYRGTRTGFRLLNGYIIDSRMFEILFFYLSTAFMQVFMPKL